MEDKIIVTIISAHRHGTNFICNLLENNFKQMTCYYELFNPDNTNPSLEGLSKLRKDDPLQFFQTIVKKTDTKIMCYKIFYDQVLLFPLKDDNDDNEFSLIESLFEFSDVVFFLHRNLLDSYISLRKAIELDFWTHKDTTHYKINFDPNDFKEYLFYQSRWFQHTKDIVKKKGIPYLDIHYETFVELDTQQQLETFTSFFKEAFSSNSESETLFSIQETIHKSKFEKQDKNKDYKDKIENFDKVAGMLQEMGYL